MTSKTDQSKSEEVQSRLKACNAEMIPILEKHGFSIGAEPFINQKTGQIFARPVFIDVQQVNEVQEKLDVKKAEDSQSAVDVAE